jgi:hypothetical protein
LSSEVDGDGTAGGGADRRRGWDRVVWAAQLLVPWWQALASQAGRFRRCSRLAGDDHCKPSFLGPEAAAHARAQQATDRQATLRRKLEAKFAEKVMMMPHYAASMVPPRRAAPPVAAVAHDATLSEGDAIVPQAVPAKAPTPAAAWLFPSRWRALEEEDSSRKR